MLSKWFWKFYIKKIKCQFYGAVCLPLSGYMIIFLIIMLGLVDQTLLSYELKLCTFSFHDMESNGNSTGKSNYLCFFFPSLFYFPLSL